MVDETTLLDIEIKCHEYENGKEGHPVTLTKQRELALLVPTLVEEIERMDAYVTHLEEVIRKHNIDNNVNLFRFGLPWKK